MNTQPLYTTQSDLINFLKSFDGAGEVLLTTVTEVPMRKTGNPYYGDVLKVQAIRALINADYEHRVNQQRRLETKVDDFQAENLRWGECHDNIVVKHDGRLYIKTIELKKETQPQYLHNHQQIPLSTIAPWMPEYRGSPKQRLDNEVKVRTFKIENIISIVIGNQVVYEKPVTLQ